MFVVVKLQWDGQNGVKGEVLDEGVVQCVWFKKFVNFDDILKNRVVEVYLCDWVVEVINGVWCVQFLNVGKYLVEDFDLCNR